MSGEQFQNQPSKNGITGVTASHGSRARRRDTPSRYLELSRTVLRSENASVPHSHTGRATAVEPSQQPWRTEKNQKYAKSTEDAVADVLRAGVLFAIFISSR
ncbi:hypothetical protein S83_001010 [Arachis hypogaea]